MRAVPLAAAWFLNILAGRMFDDHQDNEGSEEPWRTGGAAGSLAFGLYALGAANTALSHLELDPDGLTEILRAFGNTLALSAKAQGERLGLEGLTVERYLAHIVGKTGLVFATGAWAGARLAAVDDENGAVEILYDFGLNLGVAIQISDDCQDLASHDLQRGHLTLPVAYALTQKGQPQYPSLVALLEQEQRDAWVERIVGLLEDMGAIAWSRQVARIYRAKALRALEPLAQERVAPLIAFATTDDLADA